MRLVEDVFHVVGLVGLQVGSIYQLLIALNDGYIATAAYKTASFEKFSEPG